MGDSVMKTKITLGDSVSISVRNSVSSSVYSGVYSPVNKLVLISMYFSVWRSLRGPINNSTRWVISL